jgi:ABC-type glycerol-3-phosphate transport system substrate-binding protein
MRTRAAVLVLAVLTALALAGCGSSGGSGDTGSGPASGTVTVWDYYGEATPLKKAIARFTASHPKIKVKYQAFDYDTTHDKFAVATASGDAPDLATVDMTWIPSFAANGLLSDLTPLSGGKLNGKDMASQYTAGANEAMRYQGKLVAALYDFDAYALYYRKDVLDSKGIAVPKTWDDLVSASAKMAERSSPGAKPDRYALQVLPDTFHYAQLLFQNGGSILNADGTKAAFDSPQGVQALDYMKRLIDDGGGVYWPDPNNTVAGVKDQQIGMFVNGPYMMGQLKSGAPEQKGKWAVAPAPYSQQPGSYLGGTGLVVPTGAKNPRAAWELMQFLLQPAQQQLVYTEAGAAPATSAALSLPALSKPDPYFGGQAPFGVFKSSMATATHFPYVSSWGDIDKSVTDAVTSVLLGKAGSQEALSKAADTTDGKLGN